MLSKGTPNAPLPSVEGTRSAWLCAAFQGRFKNILVLLTLGSWIAPAAIQYPNSLDLMAFMAEPRKLRQSLPYATQEPVHARVIELLTNALAALRS